MNELLSQYSIGLAAIDLAALLLRVEATYFYRVVAEPANASAEGQCEIINLIATQINRDVPHRLAPLPSWHHVYYRFENGLGENGGRVADRTAARADTERRTAKVREWATDTNEWSNV